MVIRLSDRSGDAAARLQRALRLPERPPLLRLAFALGVRYCGGVLPPQEDSKGPEIPMKVVTAGNDLLLDAVIIEALRSPGVARDATERRRAYKCLVDFGLEWLDQDFERLGKPTDYLVSLAQAHLG